MMKVNQISSPQLALFVGIVTRCKLQNIAKLDLISVAKIFYKILISD